MRKSGNITDYGSYIAYMLHDVKDLLKDFFKAVAIEISIACD